MERSHLTPEGGVTVCTHRARSGELAINSETCEVKVRGEWIELTIEDALRLDASRTKRCPECQGQVRAHTNGSNGMRAHFEHFRRHDECSRSDAFKGTPKLHPCALS